MRMQKILNDLVAFETVGGNDKEIENCYKYISKSLKFFPFIEKRYEKNKKVSYVWLTEDTLKPKIVLSGHIDVVPASKKMFSMKQNKDKLRGRGVNDMKFAVAIFIEVLEEMYKENGKLPSLGIMLTSDEEVGGMNGTGYLVNEVGYRPKVVVIPDGGNDWHIIQEAKGVLHVELTTKGKSSHSSRPWEGKNAIDLLMADLIALRREFPELKKEVWETTMNIGQIHAGTQTNQVCDEAKAYLDFRYVSQEKIKKLWSRIENVCRYAKLRKIVVADSFFVKKDDKYVKLWRRLISEYRADGVMSKEHGASDGRYFTTKGVSVVLSKPNGGLVHTEKEWLDIKAMDKYKKVLKEFVEQVG